MRGSARAPAPLDLALPADLAARGIALRPTTPGDAAFLRGLYGTHRAAELAPVPWEQAAKDAFIDQQFAAQAAHFAANRPLADLLLVTRDEAAIGRLYIDRSVDPWRLAELGLTPSESGGGTGAALVRWALDSARAAGASGIDLHVAIENERGADFYRRLGFVAVQSDFESHHRLLHAFERVS